MYESNIGLNGIRTLPAEIAYLDKPTVNDEFDPIYSYAGLRTDRL